MARRLFMHVGCTKTGTSFLQSVLWNNRDALAERGLVLPRTRRHHFRATVFARDLWRERPAAERIAADWRALVRAVHDTDDDVLVTHELFSAVTAEQARRTLDALGGAEVHIVLTVRDLARQLPAQWQQDVKEGAVDRLDDYVKNVVSRAPSSSWFWTLQDVPAIAGRWGEGVPGRHLHLVTVPQRGVDPDVLWSRFASVVGVDERSVDLSGTRSNESLGAVEVELLRRVNECRDDRFPLLTSHRWFKDLLANDILAGRTTKQRFAVDPGVHEWVLETSRRTVDELGSRGYDIVGDLNELIPPDEPGTGTGPSDIGEEELLRAAAETIVDLLDAHRNELRRRDAT
jgi:hypothetical protein